MTMNECRVYFAGRLDFVTDRCGNAEQYKFNSTHLLLLVNLIIDFITLYYINN